MRRDASLVTPRRRKVMGIHYTPRGLATFVAARLAGQAMPLAGQPLRVLDPACGDGILLDAFLASRKGVGDSSPCELVGIEADEVAAGSATSRLQRLEGIPSTVIHGDFLRMATARLVGPELFDCKAPVSLLDFRFDVVIANPPYVRTQHLGAEEAQRLALRFGLSGRVDLYHAFLIAATESLRPGGLIGVITSNRFLSTLGGRAVRAFLASQYEIEEVIDLGDTKLFEAAVLPAIFFGRKRDADPGRATPRRSRFTRVYSTTSPAGRPTSVALSESDLVDALQGGKPGSSRLAGGGFEISRGELKIGADPSDVWGLTTESEARWIERVHASSRGVVGDVAMVRVGIKTTADEVFIRKDWDSLSPEMRPERKLLKPLLTHEEACRWSLADGTATARRVLYPHCVSKGGRQVVDLRSVPRASRYLEAHRERLERRRYVLDAGRRWYEIWVPQDPGAWDRPKIVFPDISPGPRFHLDLEGRVVNGDCYWVSLRPGHSPDLLFLLLAVANSSLAYRYHGLVFNNRLYSGRRRYITQYVAKYPLPDPNAAAAREAVAIAKGLVAARRSSAPEAELHRSEFELDAVIEEAFRLRSSGDPL